MKASSKQIESFILNWITEYYGDSEADDPSYDIELLSEDLAKKLGEA